MSCSYSCDIHAVKLCQVGRASYARYFGSHFILSLFYDYIFRSIVYFHVEKSLVPPCPVPAAFWYGFISFRGTETAESLSVLSAAGAGEDIPDSRIGIK
jgi:hypothetical protein